MSGFSIWGHDVGGYLDGPFSNVSPADLFIRWTQFGCFSPIMQMHRTLNKTFIHRQYPWGYPEQGESIDANQALDNYRFYATLHTRLFPYLYTQAQKSSQTGEPILRPLVLIHPDDPKTSAIQDEYYFGADLIVAPVIEPRANNRKVYLPEGAWFDYWTNERHNGGQEISWTNPTAPDAPKSKIPAFVREGAVLPLILGDSVQTLCDEDYVSNSEITTWDGGLEVSVYPAGRSQFTMFDGAAFVCQQTGGAITLTIDSPTPRAMLLRVLSQRPAAVRRDGNALIELPTADAFASASEAWRFDANSGFVLVKYHHAAGASVVVL